MFRQATHRKLPKVNILRRLNSTKSASSNDFQLTTLPNGVRVASNPLPGHFAAMGLYVDAGSRYEDKYLAGASHIMDRLAFKSTSNRSSSQMAEDLESLGGNYACTSSRETIMYQASVFNSDIEGMFEALSDTVKNPLITDEEVANQRLTAQYENQEIWQKPELILPELIHIAAFEGGLGNALLCPDDRLESMTPQLMKDYRKRLYTPDRIVAAFVSVDHDRAVELTEKYLGNMVNTCNEKVIKPKSDYVAREITIPMPPPIGNLPQFSQMYIAFEGLSISDPDVYALATLQTLLGGGGSFSAGGPGKGMYSRMYTRVLNQYGYIESAQSFNHSYSDTGLFGISSSCIPQAAPFLPEIIAQQFAMVMSKSRGALKWDEVERAKNQLKSSLLMNLESKMIELEDLGRQVQINGYKVPVTEMCEKIEQLEVSDIRRVAERVFTGTNPTVVFQGDRESFGDVDSVFRKYGLGKTYKKFFKW